MYKEIIRLRDMLDSEGISYAFKPLYDGYQNVTRTMRKDNAA